MEHYPNCKSDFSFIQVGLPHWGTDVLQCNECGAVEKIKGTNGPKEIACPVAVINHLMGGPLACGPDCFLCENVTQVGYSHCTGREDALRQKHLGQCFLLADLTVKASEIVRIVNSGEACGSEFLLGSKPRRHIRFDLALNGRPYLNADAVEDLRLWRSTPCPEYPQKVCQHRFMWFGTQDKRRCADCGQVEEGYPLCQRVGHEWFKTWGGGSAVCARCGKRTD